jgi:hypothetical protein
MVKYQHLIGFTLINTNKNFGGNAETKQFHEQTCPGNSNIANLTT